MNGSGSGSSSLVVVSSVVVVVIIIVLDVGLCHRHRRGGHYFWAIIMM